MNHLLSVCLVLLVLACANSLNQLAGLNLILIQKRYHCQRNEVDCFQMSCPHSEICQSGPSYFHSSMFDQWLLFTSRMAFVTCNLINTDRIQKNNQHVTITQFCHNLLTILHINFFFQRWLLLYMTNINLWDYLSHLRLLLPSWNNSNNWKIKLSKTDVATGLWLALLKCLAF